MQKEQKPGDPFQGVWYASGRHEAPNVPCYPGHKFVYCGGKATYCVWHRPMAIYSPEVDKTFFVFGNADNSPAISCLDHASRTFARPVVLGSNPDGDAHRNPTLHIDEDGLLYVFYGAHNDPTIVVRSDAPYDMSRWSRVADIADEATSYPQPWQLRPGELFVAYRQPPGWWIRKSTNKGASWQERKPLLAYSARRLYAYAVTIAENGAYPRRIHMAWSKIGKGTPDEAKMWCLAFRRYNVYYAYSEDGGDTWRRSDGTVYSLPITDKTAEKIYDCGERGVWLKDIRLDSEGNPYILFVESDSYTYEASWKIAGFSSRGWDIHDITTSDHMYDHGEIVILADDDFRIYAPTTAAQPHEDGGEIEEWQSQDKGATWKNTATLTSGSRYSHNHVRTVLNHEKGHGDFRVFWSYGDSTYPPATKDVHMYYYGERLDGPKRIGQS